MKIVGPSFGVQQAEHYRSEIDGLRAIAVSMVVLYHFGLTKLGSGGFVGVDVFFVISGYLITSALEKNLKDGWAGLAEFYRRRILRIFPALFVVMLVCAIIEIAIKFPQNIGVFSKAFAAAILFCSNILFSQDVGYFEFISRDNTLLHTWSLSVEEQFYLILPFILIAIGHVSRKTAIALLFSCALASLVAAQIYVGLDRNLAFYLTPFRIWELLIGSALSLNMIPKVQNRILGEAISVSGLLLILGTGIVLARGSPFPGVNALGPVVGTAMVLLGTEQNRTLSGRMLSLWPMRIVGLASYSFYLWHWPVYVYSKYFYPSSGHITRAALVAFSLSLALLSWRFVEMPARKYGRRLSTRAVILTGVTAMGVLLLFSALIVPISRYLWPDNAGANSALGAVKKFEMRSWRFGTCFTKGSEVLSHVSECLTVARDKKNVLLLGDSHIAQLWNSLRQTYPDVNFMQATAGSCTIVQSFGSAQCEDLMRYMTTEFLLQNKVDVVILGGRWEDKQGERIRTEAQKLLKYTKEVIVIGPFQDYTLPFAEVVARSRYANKPSIIDFYRVKETRARDAALSALPWGNNIHYVSGMAVMCHSQCATDDDQGNLMMFDNEHLTAAGALHFARNAKLVGISKP